MNTKRYVRELQNGCIFRFMFVHIKYTMINDGGTKLSNPISIIFVRFRSNEVCLFSSVQNDLFVIIFYVLDICYHNFTDKRRTAIMLYYIQLSLLGNF